MGDGNDTEVKRIRQGVMKTTCLIIVIVMIQSIE